MLGSGAAQRWRHSPCTACTSTTPGDTRTRGDDRDQWSTTPSRHPRAARSPSPSPATSTSRRTSARCCRDAALWARSPRTLRRADVAMVNLETPVTERGRRDPRSSRSPRDRYYFRTPPRAMDVLADAGVDVVSVANNHAGDYGEVGLADTIGRGPARAGRRGRRGPRRGRGVHPARRPHGRPRRGVPRRRHRVSAKVAAASGRPDRTTPGSRRPAAAVRACCSTPSSRPRRSRTWSWSTCTGAARTRRAPPRASACSAASWPTRVPTSSSAATRTCSAVPAGPATPTSRTASATSSGTTRRQPDTGVLTLRLDADGVVEERLGPGPDRRRRPAAAGDRAGACGAVRDWRAGARCSGLAAERGEAQADDPAYDATIAPIDAALAERMRAAATVRAARCRWPTCATCHDLPRLRRPARTGEMVVHRRLRPRGDGGLRPAVRRRLADRADAARRRVRR